MSKIRLLAVLENKTGTKWLNFYENNTGKIPFYYYTCYNGGGKLGADKTYAASIVLKVAKSIGGLKLQNETK